MRTVQPVVTEIAHRIRCHYRHSPCKRNQAQHAKVASISPSIEAVKKGVGETITIGFLTCHAMGQYAARADRNNQVYHKVSRDLT